MSHVRRYPLLLLLLVLAAWCSLNSLSFAQEAASSEEEVIEEPYVYPVGYVSIRSVDRVFDVLEALFEAGGHPEAIDAISVHIADNNNELKGLDRTRPAGAMLFLSSALGLQVNPVIFLPSDGNARNLLDTLGTMRPFRPDVKVIQTGVRYEIDSRRGPMHVYFRDGYAYLSPDELALNEYLPDPATEVSALATRYDLAVQARVDSIPPGMRQILGNFIRINAETNLQQRDDENIVAYRMRRAKGLRDIELLEMLLKDCDSLTIGMSVMNELHQAEFEFMAEARPDSELADYFSRSGSVTNRYASLIQDREPMTLAMSWMLLDEDKQVNHQYIDAIELFLKQHTVPEAEGFELAVAGADPAFIEIIEETKTPESVRRVIQPLRATNDSGQFDLFVQAQSLGERRLRLVGATHLVGAESMQQGLRLLLDELAPKMEGMEVIVDAEQRGDLSFHCLAPLQLPQQGRLRFLGEAPCIWLAAGRDALWFGIGEDDVVDELDRISAEVANAPPAAPGASYSAPTYMSFSAIKWVGTMAPEPAMEYMENVGFTEENDLLTVTMRSTEHGFRSQLHLEEGYFNFLGTSLSRAILGLNERDRQEDNEERTEDRRRDND